MKDHQETSAHAQFWMLRSLCAQPVMHTSWFFWGAESWIISMGFKSAQAARQTDEQVIRSHFKVVPWSSLLLLLWLWFLEGLRAYWDNRTSWKHRGLTCLLVTYEVIQIPLSFVLIKLLENCQWDRSQSQAQGMGPAEGGLVWVTTMSC